MVLQQTPSSATPTSGTPISFFSPTWYVGWLLININTKKDSLNLIPNSWYYNTHRESGSLYKNTIIIAKINQVSEASPPPK